MNGLGDSLTIGILLTLIFGAVSFYIYSRLSQNEKRVSLLENLLLNLKMSTEASMMGPDMVEPTSSPIPLDKNDVDEVSEMEYTNMLKEMPASASSAPLVNEAESINAVVTASSEVDNAGDEQALLRSIESIESPTNEVKGRKMDANYESMSLKELQALVRQRGINGVPSRKRDLIDALKKQGGSAPLSATPLPVAEDELGGAGSHGGPFKVELEQEQEQEQ